MALINLRNKFEEIKEAAEQVKFSDVRLTANFQRAFEQYISENSANGYSSVEWADFSTKIITSTSKSIFLPNYWFYLASKLAEYLGDLSKHRELFKQIFSNENLNSVATELRSDINNTREQEIKTFFKANGYSDQDYNHFRGFLSDYSSWGGGKTIDRDDYYVSPLMKAGNLLAETQSAVAEISKIFFNSPEIKQAFQPTFTKPKPIQVIAPEQKNLSILPKPFILLAGISGTGKTRFVREQAHNHGVNNKNFCQIPVRPDWHEPSDLLGYVSRISGTKYIATKALQFMIEAWRVVAPNANATSLGELDLTVPPYWLCLDEMNLAPVEQYFSDYLSVLESRKFKDGEYSCEPLLDKSILTIDAGIRTDLGLQDDDGLWEYFLNHGIPLPPNLIVAGTVNMDETTHGFSRKVIDRALTIDFGEFFPNDYSKFFTEQDAPKLFSYSLITQASQSDLSSTVDPDGQKTIAFLDTINKILKQTPFELAYRALNELLLHVACFNPQDEITLQAVWDDFLMSKVLPRIDGDDDKLRIVGITGTENLLNSLSTALESQLGDIWSTEKTRKDLFREAHDGSEINNIPCRSRNKLEWMKKRLDANTFTSFWP